MSYSIEAIKAKLKAQTSKEGDENKFQRTKISFWKPELGEHDIRILPYADSNGQPVQEVVYYSNLDDNDRFVAPSMFGLPDPVKQKKEEFFKEYSPENKKFLPLFKEKARVYIVLLDRAAEDKLAQVWEVSPTVRDRIYGIIAHKDNQDEQMFDTEVGYDFTVTVTQEIGQDGKPKVFKGKPVKKFDLTPRKRPSKLHKDPSQVKAIVASVPKLEAYFKAQVKSSEQLMEILEERIAVVAGTTGMSSSLSMMDKAGEPSVSDLTKAFDGV